MALIVIPLKDLAIDAERKVDPASLPKEELVSRVKDSFGFLSSSVEVSIDDEVVSIQITDEKAERVNDALKLYQKAVKIAERGEYLKAIKDFEKVLETIPHHVDARRNLGMAYLESGNVAKAKQHLKECLQLEPNNSGVNLLLGNIHARHDRDLAMAETYYRKCHEINPNDNLLLNNYAALMMEKGDLAKAQDMFEKALEIDPSYPNTYYGLAMVQHSMERPELAVQTLERLFSQPRSADIRTAPMYKLAREMCRELNKEIAEGSFSRLMGVIVERKDEIERQSGFPVQVVEDNSLEYVSAVAQMAWKHHRDEHVVKYRKKMTAVTPHLIAHELEHIALEEEARKAGKNRHFMTTAATREYAIRSVGGHVEKLQKWGYPDNGITQMILQTTANLCNQLFNCPLDMMIEYRLFENMKDLRASQFVSLCQLQEEALPSLTNKEIKRLTPPLHFSCQYRA